MVNKNGIHGKKSETCCFKKYLDEDNVSHFSPLSKNISGINLEEICPQIIISITIS
jgi:hypothetical protein